MMRTRSTLRAPGFVAGAALPFRGLSYLLHRPRLWPLVALPLLINLVIFAVLLGWGFSEFAATLDAWLAGHEGWYWSALVWLVRILFWAVVLVVVYFIFTPVALLVASPFNDRLAESVEHTFGFAVDEHRPLLKALVGDAVYSVVNEVKRSALALAVFVLLLALNLVPVIGPPAYVVAAFAWASWSAALEFTGFAADRRRMGLRRKWGLLRSRFGLSAGFGLVTALFLMVPFLNVLVVPVCAVGGTMLLGMLLESGPSVVPPRGSLSCRE